MSYLETAKQSDQSDQIITQLLHCWIASTTAQLFAFAGECIPLEKKHIGTKDWRTSVVTNMSDPHMRVLGDKVVLEFTCFTRTTKSLDDVEPVAIYNARSPERKQEIVDHWKQINPSFSWPDGDSPKAQTLQWKFGSKTAKSSRVEWTDVAYPDATRASLGENIEFFQQSSGFAYDADFDWAVTADFEVVPGSEIGFSVIPTIKASTVFPIELAYWATSSDKKTFRPYLFYVWIKQALLAWAKGRSAKIDLPLPFVDPRELSKALANNPANKPRVNENRLCINRNGILMYVPAVDNTSEFSGLIDKAFDRTNGVIVGNPMKEFSGKVLLTDWVNSRLYYITESDGEINSLSLSGAIKANNASMYSLLSRPFSLFAYYNFIKRCCSVADAMGVISSIPFTKSFTNDEDGTTVEVTPAVVSAMELLESVISAAKEYKSDDLSLVDVISNGKGRTMTLKMRLTWLHQVMTTLRLNVDKIKVSEYAKITSVMPMVYTLGLRANEIEAIHADYQKERLAVTKVGAAVPQQVPNLKISDQFTGFLPHQAATLDGLSGSPRAAALAVDTGGGKTALLTSSSLQMLGRNKVRRSLTLTKSKLIADTVTEINRLSNGNVNAIPLLPSTISRLVTNFPDKYKSVADIVKWVTTQPINTLFITSYSALTSTVAFFDEEVMPVSFFDKPTNVEQFLFIILACNFDLVQLDESHQIKNPTSRRTINSLNVMSRAEYVREASGTFLTNNVTDTVGQYAGLDPSTFGTLDRFNAEFGIKHGIVDNENTARAIRARARQTVNVQTRSEMEWAWLLPISQDKIFNVKLTEVQSDYYRHLMQEAYIDINRRLQEKAKTKKVKEESDDEEEDDADDEISSVELQASLARVEQFIAAPDSDPDFVAWTDKEGKSRVGPTDLISPAVKVADDTIAGHLASRTDKIMVFGYHISVVEHFFRRSKYGNSALVYFAGDDEIMIKFKTDPKYRVLIAAENSIKEGENLQMVGHLIRLQTLWSPGDQKQAKARMYRPDPRGVYNRDTVGMTWINTYQFDNNPTFDVAKTARFISKMISNYRVQYGEQLEFKSVRFQDFDSLPQIKMSLDLIFEAKLHGPSDKPHDNLGRYLESMEVFQSRFNVAMQNHRIDKIKQLEKKFNVTLLDKNGKTINTGDVARYAILQLEKEILLPGSAKTWTPWVAGSIPSHPEIGAMKLAVGPALTPGQLVYTEYGPGKIETVGDKSCNVTTAIGKLRIGKMLLAIPNTKEGEATLKKLSENLARSARVPEGVKISVPALKGDPKIETPVGKQTVSKLATLDMEASLVNGMPCLMAWPTSPAATKLLDADESWLSTTAYYAIRIVNTAAFNAILTALDKKFLIKSARMSQLRFIAKHMIRGVSLIGTQYPNARKGVQSFFKIAHKAKGKLEGKYVCSPYLIAHDDSTYMCFDADTHNPKVIEFIKENARKLTKNPASLQPSGFILIGDTIGEVRASVKELQDAGANFDLDKIKEELVQLKSLIAKVRVMNVDEDRQPAKKAASKTVIKVSKKAAAKPKPKAKRR